MDEASSDEDDPLLTTREVAQMLRVDPNTVAKWARLGKLHALRTPGGRPRFRRSDVNDALAKAKREVENT